MLTGAALVVAFFGPGLCYVLAGWRVAGRWLVSTAPAASILLIGWTGWLTGRIGRQPGPVALLLLAAGLGAAAGLGLRFLARDAGACRRPARGPAARTVGVAVTALIAAGVLASWLWTRTPGWQDSIPRYWDGTWHGYLIAVVHRTGIVDGDRLVPLDPQLLDWLDYYPSGWHIPVGTVVTLSGGSVPSGYNLGQLLFVAVVLPLGIVSLVRALGLRSRLVLLLAPALTVLAYPVQAYLVDTTAFAAALALAPAALAAVVLAARDGWPLPRTLAAAVATAGVFLVQPSAVVAVGLVAGCFLLARCRGRARATLVGACGWVVTTAALVLPWLLGSLTHAQVTLDYSRPGQLPYLDGIYQLLVQYRGTTPAPTLPVLLGVAVVVLLAGRAHRWLVAATTIFAILFLVALSAASPLRQLLTGFWYTDWFRLGGIFWLLAVLVVLAALDTVLRGLRSGRRTQSLSALALAGLVVAAAWAAPAWVGATQARLAYARGAQPLVSPADRTAFAYLREQVRPGERVLNDWPDGSGWMYALEGVDPLMATMGSNLDAGRVYLVEHFGELGRNARVADLLHRYSIRYVYTAPAPGRSSAYRLRLPPDAAGLTLVFEAQGTRVYRIDG